MMINEYMLLADGSVLVFPGGISTAHEIGHELIERKGIAYYWAGSTSKNNETAWYVILPIFVSPGGIFIGCKAVPAVIKLAALMLE